MSIIKLTPAFKDYLWGGTKLKENYGKKQIWIQLRRAGNYLCIQMVQALLRVVNIKAYLFLIFREKRKRRFRNEGKHI